MICIRCGVEIKPFVLESEWQGRPAGTSLWADEGSIPCDSADWDTISGRHWRDDELHTPFTLSDIISDLKSIEADLR